MTIFCRCRLRQRLPPSAYRWFAADLAEGGGGLHTGHVAVITQLVGNKVRIAEQNVIHSPLPQASSGPAS